MFQELPQLAVCAVRGEPMRGKPCPWVPWRTGPGSALGLALLSLAPSRSQGKDRADCLGEVLQGNLDVRSVAESSSHSSSRGAGGLATVTGSSGARGSRGFGTIRNNCLLR